MRDSQFFVRFFYSGKQKSDPIRQQQNDYQNMLDKAKQARKAFDNDKSIVTQLNRYQIRNGITAHFSIKRKHSSAFSCTASYAHISISSVGKNANEARLNALAMLLPLLADKQNELPQKKYSLKIL